MRPIRKLRGDQGFIDRGIIQPRLVKRDIKQFFQCLAPGTVIRHPVKDTEIGESKADLIVGCAVIRFLIEFRVKASAPEQNVVSIDIETNLPYLYRVEIKVSPVPG